MFTMKPHSTSAGIPFSFTSPRLFGAAVAALTGAQAVLAQWTVTRLHPPGADAGFQSQLHQTQGGQQVGEIFSSFFQSPAVSRAGFWSGTADSWVDLTPTGAEFAAAQGVYNGQQAGWIQTGDTRNATLWSGTAESMVNLNPPGAFQSEATSIHGNQQGGAVSYGEFGTFRAGVWHGTAESFVDLHPAGVFESAIDRVRDGSQVGITSDEFGITRASLWNGTAESHVDLNPVGAFASRLTDVHDGQQVGFITNSSFLFRAGLWSGTAESFVDLTPAGAIQSVATGVYDGLQVGWAEFTAGIFVSRAGFWSGTAESWVDLHQFLEGTWRFSTASSIWRDGDTIYISGSGIQGNDALGQHEALLWTYTIPSPGTGALLALGLTAITRRRRSA